MRVNLKEFLIAFGVVLLMIIIITGVAGVVSFTCKKIDKLSLLKEDTIIEGVLYHKCSGNMDYKDKGIMCWQCAEGKVCVVLNKINNSIF